MKLTGWQRIGIVASGLWFVGAGLFTLKVASDHDEEVAQTLYAACSQVRDEADSDHRSDCQRKADLSDKQDVFAECMAQFHSEYEWLDQHCTDEQFEHYKRSQSHELDDAAFVAIVPIPFAWGLAYFILFLLGWIRRGFRAK
jgi:hypothetical protein